MGQGFRRRRACRHLGLAHRTLGQIDAIGVDEIRYANGHKYLTLVYQIDLDVTRLLWVGRERPSNPFGDFSRSSETNFHASASINASRTNASLSRLRSPPRA